MGRKRTQNTHLPKYVYKRRKGYSYRDKETGCERIIGYTEREMLENYAKIVSAPRRPPQGSWAKDLARTVRKNAKTRNIEVAIDEYWILEQFDLAGGKCAVSGIPFDFGFDSKYRRRPFMPSVDRVDSSKAYTPENCRLVCSAANYAMNEWDDDVLIQLARGVTRTLGRF